MAIFEIEANGKTYEVDAPDQAAAVAAFQTHIGGAATEPAKADRIPIISDIADFSNAFQAGATEGMTLGFADELNAGAQAPFRAIGDAIGGKGFDLGKAYDDGLKDTRGYVEEQKAKNPAAAVAGDITGSLVTGGTLAKGGVTLMNGAKSLPGLVGRGAVEGAAYGGVSGFGRSEGDSLEDRGRDAAWGAGFGGVAGGGLTGVAGALASRAAKAAVPTVEDLKSQAGALYDQARGSGFIFTTPEVAKVADDIAAKAISEGLDPTLHPGATAALKRLQDAKDKGMTVGDAQTMRRILAAAAKDPMNPDQARIAGQMIDQFDQFTATVPELAQANAIYHQAKKGELIEQAIELAQARAGQYSNGGMENALRTEFRNLQRQIIRGQLKGLSQEEIDAITKVAEGGPIENLARWVGKAAPTGIVSAGMGTGVPFAIGTTLSGGNPAVGAVAAGATMGAGIAGRSAAEAMTVGNATKAALLARSGGKAIPRGQLAGPNREVLRALIAAGGNEGAEVPFYVTPRRATAN